MTKKMRKETPKSTPACSCGGKCGPGSRPGVGRREFLKVAGAGVVASLVGSRFSGIMAGPFKRAEAATGYLIPEEKKLSQEWVKALFERGTKEVFRGKSLDTIGMPCGGIGSGQLYLCGDGTLGCWQIFNDAKSNWVKDTNATYKHRGIPKPVDQGFAVAVRGADGKMLVKTLSCEGFADVEFQGEYPLATIRYADAACPVKVEMEAFSPFIPLNAADSALPATVFHLTVENTSSSEVEFQWLGWLQNAVCNASGKEFGGTRSTRFLSEAASALFQHGAEQLPPEPKQNTSGRKRSTIVFANFDKKTYGKWKAEGDAFGKAPAKGTLTGQQTVTGFKGKGLVNSFLGGDAPTGTLTSPAFKIKRKFINFLIGGGDQKDATCINLVVDGKVVRTAVGRNKETLEWQGWLVKEFEGKKAQLVIVDKASGGWGHVNVDQIEFADEPKTERTLTLGASPDFGTMALGCAASCVADALLGAPAGKAPESFLRTDAPAYSIEEDKNALLATPVAKLAAGQRQTVTFVLAWHFPNQVEGQFYATKFKDAAAVARYIIDNDTRLTADTHLWRDTYYDSTLPYWLLDRLHSTVSYLATGTCQWWKNGRFYAYEGVTCCEGTCTHVWNYAHSEARLFPELTRSVREMQDFCPREKGGGFHPDTGLVGFRSNDAYAADGQCGTILKAYREHLMSADDTFLKRNWPRIKKALEFSIEQDANSDGLIENKQHNTYDINYYGANTFVGSLYLAALRAGEQMALEVGDNDFAKRAKAIFESGRDLTMKRLWNGEYFTQDVDLKEHPKDQYKDGCLSDQLFGQGWAHQVGLGYIYPKESVLTALKSIWKYNWAPDVGPYNEAYKPFRWFITPGQAGLITCTWPKGDYLAEGTMYREEVWTGIEYQVAGHMIREGMVEEGLAMCRAVHDRYHPDLFNPYNEVECGDHYARAMASWGVYLSLAGFDYHGPKGHLAFAPRITPGHFRMAFTAAEGWGTFEQKRDGKKQNHAIAIHWGQLRLTSLSFELPDNTKRAKVAVELDGKSIEATTACKDGYLSVTFKKPVVIKSGQTLSVAASGQ